jgi:hypothetical protein
MHVHPLHGDDSVSGDARRKQIAETARVRVAVLQAAAEVIVAEANLEAGGHPVLVRATPSVLDARRRDLDRMSLQAEAWLAAMRIVNGWLLPRGDSRSLGTILKVAPPEDAAELRRLLQLAGVLPQDGAR